MAETLVADDLVRTRLEDQIALFLDHDKCPECGGHLWSRGGQKERRRDCLTCGALAYIPHAAEEWMVS